MEVPRIEKPSRKDFLTRYVSPGKPVILTNAVDDWRATRRWTPDTLGTLYPSLQLRVTVLDEPRAAAGKYYLTNRRYQTMSFAQYTRLMRERGAASYLENQPLPMAMREDLGEFCYFPRTLQRLAHQPPRLWIGPSGATTACHTDPLDNLNVQLWGRKRWTIFPPSAREALGIPSELSPRNISPFDLSESPALRNSKWCKLPRATFVLGPRETLFLPQEWPHFVQTLETSIAVNFWFQQWSEAALRAPAFYLRRAIKSVRKHSRHSYGR